MDRYRANYWGKRRKRRGRTESKREQEKAKKPLLGKACHQGAETTWNSCPQTPGSLQTNNPTQNEKIRKGGWGGGKHTKKIKKIKRGGKRGGREPTCEVLFVVLARNGEKKKHEEAAKCGGEKGGGEETAPGANCTKPRQECREAGPLFLPSRLELISFRPLQETQTWGRTDVLRLF